MINANVRTVERLNMIIGEWERIRYEELKSMDIFRISEPDGSPVLSDGLWVLIASSDSYFDENGTCKVEILDMSREIK